MLMLKVLTYYVVIGYILNIFIDRFVLHHIDDDFFILVLSVMFWFPGLIILLCYGVHETLMFPFRFKK